MSKRKQSMWDDGLNFGQGNTNKKWPVELYTDEEDNEEVMDTLEEAHEALSKLYQKTSKRQKTERSMRKREAYD